MQFKAQFSFYIRKMLHNFSGVRRFLLFTRSTSFQLHLRVLQRRPERRSNLWGLPEGRQAVQELRLQDGWNAALQQTQHHHHGGPLRVLAQRQPSIFALRERWTLKPPPRQMWPSACCRPPHPYPCDDGGEQLQEGGQRLQLSLGDASERRVAVLRRVRVRQVSPQVLVVEHEGVKKVFP